MTQPIKLFNGKDLTDFYTCLKQGIGKNNDPDKVFTVQDGMIRVSGEEFGGFTTEKEYENYHLVVEFKWGEKTWRPREQRIRDSGILLHCVGEDGAAGGVWMESIECQMIEGGTGDFILVKGKNSRSVTATVEKTRQGSGTTTRRREPAKFPPRPRINWCGRDPDWKDVKGFRGKQDVEKPAGEWNTLECICDGDKITNILNGVVVNAGTRRATPRARSCSSPRGPRSSSAGSICCR